MKTKMLLLLVIVFTFTACEKESIEPPSTHVEVLGTWDLHHDVNGVSTNDFDIGGHTWNYSLTVHNLCLGEFNIIRDGVFYMTHKFYLNVQDDSMHLSYLNEATPMLPAPGWNMYLQYDNILLIEYQQWIKR